MFARVAIVLAVAVAVVAAQEAGVTVLTPENFDDVVGGSKPVLVEFYAPWCGHCKALAPEYEKAGATFRASDPIVIANVDADAHRDLGGKFGVSGFPTLKWFPAGSTTPEDYTGGRTAADLVKFINTKTGLNRKVKEAPSFVTTLTPDNFDSIVMDADKDVLVEFYAPWCGHCKQLAPKYEELGKTFAGEEGVVIAKLDADEHREVSQTYGVSGFPTLKFFPKGSSDKSAEDYTGGRELNDLVDFINSNAGTERLPGGGLSANAGRLGEFDEYAQKFMASSADRASIMEDAKNAMSVLTEEEAVVAARYLKVMDKVGAKGDGFPAKEHKRLSGMIDSDAVGAAKKTSFMLRRNVLSAFLDE